MPEDSSETSLSAEFTGTGIKAAAKSRAIAAVDRLVGNVADLGGVWIEGVTTRKRAKNEGERQLIEAAARYGIERMGYDEEFAKRAFENHFKKVAQAQANKDAVAHEAIQDLRRHNPTEEETNSGPEAVSEEFMARFEGYAEGALTEQLRERWGRILASEIRKPGTFNSKVLRATDELDSETAKLFESLMPYRNGDVLVKSLVPELSFNARMKLVSGGLIVDPGFTGHLRFFASATAGDGTEYWANQFGGIAIAYKKEFTPNVNSKEVLTIKDGTPSMPIYLLTDIGHALSSILPSQEEQVGLRYGSAIKSFLPDGEIKVWRMLPNGSMQIIQGAI